MRKLKILFRDELLALPTPRLLAYLRRLNQCHEHSDEGIFGESDRGNVTKDSEVWKNLHFLVKDILSSREHVEKQGRRVRKLQKGVREAMRVTDKSKLVFKR